MGGGKPITSDAAFIEALLSRTRGVITGLTWQWSGAVNSDVLPEAKQEARALLAKALPKLERLPAEEQEAYAATCLRHAVARTLRRERKHKCHTISIEDLSPHDRRALELREAAKGEKPSLLSPEDLLMYLDDPLLADAFASLSPDDRWVIFLAAIEDCSDTEIASALNITPAAAKKRRQRAREKMRTFILKSGGGRRFQR